MSGVQTAVLDELRHMRLGERAGPCQYCGRPLTEGDDIVVYAYKPADDRTVHVGHCVCGHTDHRQQTVFTLGVRELLVAGRVGVASDAATQSTWPILIEPVPLGVSAAATTSMRWLPAETPTADQSKPTPIQKRKRQVARTQVTIPAGHDRDTEDHP